MTSIEWLSIQGVRSFSPKERQNIKFLKPLTIILGSNGAGKTTVIECLKTACTGELPPNSQRGKSFIQDPKVAGDSEVKAQIRLKFKAANKKRMCVIRSYQLTQKQKKAEFKHLESAIVTSSDDGKDTVSNSYKCSEMDKLVPECMGISKAILENVIFCHQEDVNWPLEDSATLKKKFDDIFASTRYTKALDTIKKFKKEQNELIKDLEGQLGVEEERLTQAIKMRKEKELEKYKVQQLNEQIEEINDKMQELDTEIIKYDQVYDSIRGINNQIRQVEAQKEMLSKTVQEMFKQLEHEFTETDEEIVKYKKDFVEQLKTLENEKELLERKLHQLKLNQETFHNELNSLKFKLGQAESEKNGHERRVQVITAQICEISKRNDISGFSNPPFSEQQIMQFLKHIDSLIELQNQKMNDKKYEHQKMQNDLYGKISNVQGNIKTVHTTLGAREKELALCKKSTTDLGEKLNQNKITQNDLLLSEQAVNEAFNSYEICNGKSTISDINAKILSIQNDISTTNKKISDVGHEMKQREAEKVIAYKIAGLKEEKQKQLDQLDSKFSQCKSQFQTIVNSPFTHENIETLLKEEAQRRKSKVSICTTHLQSIERDVSTFKNKVDFLDEEIKKYQQNIGLLEKKLESTTEGKDIQELLSEAESKASELREDVSMAESLKSCFENFVKSAKNNQLCPVCERVLASSELDNFIHLQQEKLEKTPQIIKRKREKLNKAEELCTRLRNLVPLQKEIDSMKLETQSKREQRSETTKSYQNKLALMEETSKEQLVLKTEEERVLKLIPDAEEISNLHKGIRAIEERIKLENSKLSQFSSSNSKSYDELRAEYEALQTKCSQLNSDLESARTELNNNQSQITALKDQWNKKKEEFQAKQLLFEKKKSLQDQYDQVQNKIQSIQQEMAKSQMTLPAMESELERLNSQLERIRHEHQQEENQIHNILQTLQKEKNSIQSSVEEITRYIENNMDDELQQLQNMQEKLKIKHEQCKTDYEKVEEEVKSKRTMIDQQGNIKRAIDDNINYRRRSNELKELNCKLQDLRTQLKSLTGQEIINDEEIGRMKSKRQKLATEKASYSGMQSTHSSNISKIEKDLVHSNYKDIDQRHRATLIKLHTTKIANKDLDKYCEALEKALMKYHTMKMTEINEIIKELWQKTYRGQDIDSIEIRADAEGTTGRRSYNYRVVMKKGDIALDMRGRCSAGQKVLACLIIRLALAEAFCIDCGFLALDEPTTNLDLDNITSLAESLQVIISERRKQSNFQLVVITHDEDFVQKLGRSEFVDYYYRVSKDPDNQCSIIEKQDFRET